jgi:hypothetical protein
VGHFEKPVALVSAAFSGPRRGSLNDHVGCLSAIMMFRLNVHRPINLKKFDVHTPDKDDRNTKYSGCPPASHRQAVGIIDPMFQRQTQCSSKTSQLHDNKGNQIDCCRYTCDNKNLFQKASNVEIISERTSRYLDNNASVISGKTSCTERHPFDAGSCPYDTFHKQDLACLEHVTERNTLFCNVSRQELFSEKECQYKNVTYLANSCKVNDREFSDENVLVGDSGCQCANNSCGKHDYKKCQRLSECVSYTIIPCYVINVK